MAALSSWHGVCTSSTGTSLAVLASSQPLLFPSLPWCVEMLLLALSPPRSLPSLGGRLKSVPKTRTSRKLVPGKAKTAPALPMGRQDAMELLSYLKAVERKD